MIFASVGGQLPFPRMIQAVDRWAKEGTRKVIAQIGDDESKYNFIESHRFIEASRFRSLVSECDVFITHAGMGNIILGSELGRPLIVMARLTSLGEHRSDHQVSTVARLRSLDNVMVLDHTDQLDDYIQLAARRRNNSLRPETNSLNISLRQVLRSLL